MAARQEGRQAGDKTQHDTRKPERDENPRTASPALPVDSHVVVDKDPLALLIRGHPRHDALGAAVIVSVGGRQHHHCLAVVSGGGGDPDLRSARSTRRARRAGEEESTVVETALYYQDSCASS